MSIKDKIREKTVGQKKEFKSETVKIDDELEVVVKEPSVAQRTKILQNSKIQSAQANGDFDTIDTGKMQAYAVIECTYTPDGKRVFEEADLDSILNSPSTTEWLDKVGEIALNLLNVQDEDEVKN